MALTVARAETVDARTNELLKPYVPRLVVNWLRTMPDERHLALESSLLFVDISGFTALTERLAKKGKIGAELMRDTLDGIFRALLDEAYDWGAGLLKWGGDALLLLFDALNELTPDDAALPFLPTDSLPPGTYVIVTSQPGERLTRLVDEGLMVKQAYEQRPVRYEYRLTDKGRAFWDVLAAMFRWGSDWLWDEEGPPVVLEPAGHAAGAVTYPPFEQPIVNGPNPPGAAGEAYRRNPGTLSKI